MNFLLTEMTHLRYFMPLIIEGNKRGVLSSVFWGKNTKYNNPSNYLPLLKEYSIRYGFSFMGIESSNEYSDTTFMVEGCGLPEIRHGGMKIVLTAMRDFTVSYVNYIDNVDRVILCSEFFAKHYGFVSEKNLYFGTPKYDVVLDSSTIRYKYEIENKKVALIIFPRLAYMDSLRYVQLLKVYSYLRNMGYTLVVKTRGKDKPTDIYKGDKYFEDFSWYPHTTQELIKVADIVINFDSTSIKECIMMSKPLINFSIKPIKRFEFMYNDRYATQLDMEVGFDKFKGVVDRLLASDLSGDFYNARDKFLFHPGNIAGKILAAVL